MVKSLLCQGLEIADDYDGGDSGIRTESNAIRGKMYDQRSEKRVHLRGVNRMITILNSIDQGHD